MAAAVSNVQQMKVDDAEAKERVEFIPDIIEEKRIDCEGELSITKYMRGKLLGKGGFAKCFLGTHMPTMRQYALKIVYKSTLAKASAKHKLQTEIKIHRALKHSYIVKFERYFEDSTNVYMVLELCSNNSMSILLKRRKRLTDLEVRYYLIQLVGALQYLHQNLVIHRDLKLGNLFIDSQMRLKVGDFGLATRLSDASERKKTFCGTPNYIAPEVLEGKDGHSFEVDVWSTGVLMYALLVGRPPFESKSVNATYKRILENSFTFPDQPTTCDHAKSLLRNILQTKPELRPSLSKILQHSFFTRPGISTPAQLPEMALRDSPVFSSLDSDLIHYKKYITPGHEVVFGDENYPKGINKLDVVSSKIKSPYSKPSGVVSLGIPPAGKENIVRSTTQALETKLQTFSLQNPSSSTNPTVAQKRERQTTTTTIPSEKRTFSNKFEIYDDSSNLVSQDSKRSPDRNAVTSLSQKTSWRDQVFRRANPIVIPIAERIQNSNIQPSKIRNTVNPSFNRVDRMEPMKSPTSSSSACQPMRGGGINDLEKLRSTFGRVNIQDRITSVAGGANQPGYENIDAVYDAKLFTKTVEMENLRKSHTASSWFNRENASKNHNMAVNSEGQSSPSQTDACTGVQPTQKSKESPESSSQPMQISTPSDQMIAVNDFKGLCTLEGMHDMLASRNLDDLTVKGPTYDASDVNRMKYMKHTLAFHAATIWVVRYVDYTSKYGLGFLFNTGSAGVYFNDSTKIVVSPDGTIFQYSERKRKDKGATSSEHTIQTHSIFKFPVELQKKVTLLRHFRNYLVDQQKGGVFPSDDGSAAGGSEAMEKRAPLDGASSGASASTPFGTSSVFFTAAESRAMGCASDYSKSPSEHSDDNPDMPFLKKWVRTKHAILFRLSSRTVQVLFMDRSEILLTSEARMVTYVSKQNVRSEHSLEEVLQTGRTDIAKRLKYVKDIMYRLISTNVK